MKKKTYVLAGINTAISLLRPGANYVIQNSDVIQWNDPRPAPSWDEIVETLGRIKAFEDSIESIEL